MLRNRYQRNQARLSSTIIRGSRFFTVLSRTVPTRWRLLESRVTNPAKRGWAANFITSSGKTDPSLLSSQRHFWIKRGEKCSLAGNVLRVQLRHSFADFNMTFQVVLTRRIFIHCRYVDSRRFLRLVINRLIMLHESPGWNLGFELCGFHWTWSINADY